MRPVRRSLFLMILATGLLSACAQQPAPPPAAPSRVTSSAGGVATKPAQPPVISHGERVSLSDHAVKGKTTVFDFSSQYCPPCQAIAPHLERLHATRDDVAVVTVDINRPGVNRIDWDSPVAEQYRLDSIPHFIVYGPDGAQQAEGDAAEKLVSGWIGG